MDDNARRNLEYKESGGKAWDLLRHWCLEDADWKDSFTKEDVVVTRCASSCDTCFIRFEICPNIGFFPQKGDSSNRLARKGQVVQRCACSLDPSFSAYQSDQTPCIAVGVIENCNIDDLIALVTYVLPRLPWKSPFTQRNDVLETILTV